MDQRDIELPKIEAFRAALKTLEKLADELHYGDGGTIIVRGFDGKEKEIEIPKLRKGPHVSDPKFFESDYWFYDRYEDGEYVKEKMNPGWYFLDEHWDNPQGPYETKEECKEALKEYAETL